MHEALHTQTRSSLEDAASFNLETLQSDPLESQAFVPIAPTIENSSIHALQAEIVAELDIDRSRLRVVAMGHRDGSVSGGGERVVVASEEVLGYFCLNNRDYAIVKPMDDVPCAAGPDAKVSFLEPLTSRELQITFWVAQGLSNKQIAHQLDISAWTVSTHLRRIFIKLQVDTRAALVYKCAPVIKRVDG
jgi:DNA-binding CsgD family transcriptional regulator